MALSKVLGARLKWKSDLQMTPFLKRKSILAYVILLLFFSCAYSERNDPVVNTADEPGNQRVVLDEEAHFVSPTGNDGNPGTQRQPWATLQHAANSLKPGDTLYAREGIYQENVNFIHSGTKKEPIIIMAYPGEKPVIDGNNFRHPAQEWGMLLIVTGKYNYVSGFEVRYSNWMGVVVSGEYSTVANFNVHHNKEQGIFLIGDHSMAENNVVWMNCLSNENGTRTRFSWGNGLAAGRHPNFAVIRNNVVFNNWGEGLSTFESNGTLIEGNVVYDNWATNIYISDATNVVLKHNLIYTTSTNIMKSGARTGIMLGDELYNPPSANIKIINNLVYGANINLYWWQGVQGGGLNDVLIANNTFINSRTETNLKINSGSHKNVRIFNNIILQDGSLPIAHVARNSELAFYHNLWSKSPPSSVFGDDDIIGSPSLLMRSSSWSAGSSSAWLKLSSSPTGIDAYIDTTARGLGFSPCTRFSLPLMGLISCD